MKDSVKLLKTLTDVNGISGYEYNVKSTMREYLEPVSDEIVEDNLGGIFGKKNAKNASKTLLLAGHLDEIGFMITHIDDDGYIKFTTIGGWWNQVMLSQKVTITTDEGKEYRGIIGSKPPHVLGEEERKKPVDVKNMFIDIGVPNKEAVEALGIAVGDMVTPYSEFEELADSNYLTAKAFDNRFGCAVSIDVLKELQNEDLGVNLVSGATVQEEVGLRGAKVAANKIKPDLAIAVDVGVAHDTPGMKGQGHETELGKGPLVLIMDGSNIGHVGFRRFIKKIAKENNINIQWSNITGGGTDAGSIHVANEGAATVSIGLPLRYMHSNVSVLHKEDYKNTVKLIAEIVKALNDDEIKDIIW